MNRPLRVGIVGCGALGRVHARKFASLPGTVVAALSDPSADAMERTAAELPDRPAILSSHYDELLDGGLDAICIASPDSYHLGQALKAMEAGLHVLCEKPLTLEPSELQEVLRTRDRTSKIMAMTYPRRYDRTQQALRAEVQSGRWGRVTTVTAYNAEDWITPNVGTWRHDPRTCPGGFFFDASGHQLDAVLWITGLGPEAVTAEGDCRGTPVPIVFWGYARLTGGVPFSFCFIGDAKSWREEINIHCEGADFVIRNFRPYRVDGRELRPIESTDPSESSEEVFVRLIESGGPAPSLPDDIWPVLRITRAGLESAEQHRTIEVK